MIFQEKGARVEVKQRESNGRLCSEFVGDINGTYLTYLRSKATQRGLEFKVSKEDLWELFQKQKGLCALSGVPLVISTKLRKTSKTGKSVDRKGHTASLDRIDNSKGYTINNVQWVHKQVNLMRRQYEVNDFLNWCKIITEFNNANS